MRYVTESMDSICCFIIAFISCVTANMQQLFIPAFTSAHLWLITHLSDRTAPDLHRCPDTIFDFQENCFQSHHHCNTVTLSSINILLFDVYLDFCGMYSSEKSKLFKANVSAQPGFYPTGQCGAWIRSYCECCRRLRQLYLYIHMLRNVRDQYSKEIYAHVPFL